MHKKFLLWGVAFGGLAVILGAFGAHQLEGMTQDQKILHAFQTAVQYQFYHSLALIATGILYEKFSHSLVRLAANFFIAGIILFSGSLYLLTILKLQESSATGIAGPVTPLGGACFIAGWALLFAGILRAKTLKGNEQR